MLAPLTVAVAAYADASTNISFGFAISISICNLLVEPPFLPTLWFMTMALVMAMLITQITVTADNGAAAYGYGEASTGDWTLGYWRLPTLVSAMLMP